MKIKLPLRKPGPPLQRPPQLKLKASVARSRRAPIIEEEDFLEEPEPNMRLSHAFVVVLVLHVIAVAGVFAFNSIKAKQADIFSAIKDEPAKSATTDDTAVASANNTVAPAAGTTGPSDGPALTQPVSQPPAVAPIGAASSAKTHELQPGETLTKVAATYGVSVADLQAANNIIDPKKMRAGMTLTIPSKDGGTTSSAIEPASYKPITAASAAIAPVATAPAVKPVTSAAAPATGALKDSGKIYVMVKGDNPVRIAKKFKVSYASLLSLNNITDPTHMQIGQKLKIPASAK